MTVNEAIKAVEAIHAVADLHISEEDKNNTVMYRTALNIIIQYAEKKLIEDSNIEVKNKNNDIFNGSIQ